MRPRNESPACFAAAVAAVLWVAACGGGGGNSGAGGNPADPGGPPPGMPQARLDRVAGCDELADAIRADATFKIRTQADSLRESGWGVNPFGGGPGPVPGVPEPSDPDVEADGGPDDFTRTNVQVAGVDEADFVETDGERIYLLDGGSLVIVDSWPPAESSLESRTAIEGQPSAMFVDAGRAVVFSSVYDDIGALGGDDVCRFIGPPVLPVEPALVGDLAPCRPLFTKVTVLDLTAAPKVVREIYVEGSYAAARRHDAIVRVVVQGGFGLPADVPDFWDELYSGEFPATPEEFDAMVDAWERAAVAAIDASVLDDWLPAQWERRAGVLERIAPRCSDVHLPAVGASEHGMTRLLALDMRQDQGEVYDALVMGHAWDIYANADRLVLAQREWDPGEGDRTALHLFGVGAGSLESTYLGSGWVPGTPVNQFSFDMQGEVLRVATTRSGTTGAEEDFFTESQIVTTRLEGGALQMLGTTGGLARDERIFSVRFVGDRGYLVTFRQTDPLFVIDLSDPAHPTVLGKLELPGFSSYMHPLGPDHLLTIGQNADETGRVLGLALRIFDVSDDANPILAHQYLFTGEGWSSANDDHRSFTFDVDRGLLTFPYVSYEGEFRSVLELFEVGAQTGFTLRGEVDHGPLLERQCGSAQGWTCAFSPEIRRGLFIEDFLYSVSGGAIVVHEVGDLATELATVLLPDASVDPARPEPGVDPVPQP